MSELEPEAVIGGYSLVEPIDDRSPATLWRAVDRSLDRPVALRLLGPEQLGPTELERVAEASTIAARVDHPNVLPIYRVADHDGRVLVASRWIRGGSLEARVSDSGGLSAVEAARILGPVASALEAAHEAGLVHGAIRGSSVLLDGTHPYLHGFGIPRWEEPREAGPSVEGDIQAIGELVSDIWDGRVKGRAGSGGSELRQVVKRCSRRSGSGGFDSAASLASALGEISAMGEPRPSKLARLAGLPNDRWVIAGIGLLALAGVTLFASLPDPEGEITETVERFGSGGGSQACELLTPALLEDYGGKESCEKRLSTRGAADLTVQSVRVSGDAAEVAALDADGRTFDLQLVQTDDKWAINAVSLER